MSKEALTIKEHIKIIEIEIEDIKRELKSRKILCKWSIRDLKVLLKEQEQALKEYQKEEKGK